MDLLSHALLSFIICRLAGLDDRFLIAPVLGGTLMDIDSIALLGGAGSYFKYHRGPTHSLIGAFVIALVLTSINHLIIITPTSEWKMFGLTFLTGINHLILDTATPWGIPLFWPFSATKYTFDIIPFFEPIIFILLLISSVLLWFWPLNIRRGQVVAIVFLILLFSSFSVRVYGRRKAIQNVKLASSSEIEDIHCFPTLRPDIWWTVLRDPYDSGYRYSLLKINSLNHQILENRSLESPYVDSNTSVILPIDTPQEAVTWSRRSSKVTDFLERARIPALDVTISQDRKWHVFWYDTYWEIQSGLMIGLMVHVSQYGEIEANFVYGRRNEKSIR